MKFYYTYMLESEKTMNRFYIGFTEDLEFRLKSHNHGNNPPTSKYKPWRIKTAIAFTDRQKALDFEVYLKSPSGRAFTKKTIIKSLLYLLLAETRKTRGFLRIPLFVYRVYRLGWAVDWHTFLCEN